MQPIISQHSFPTIEIFSDTRYRLLWYMALALSCICQAHPFFGRSLYYLNSRQRRCGRVFLWQGPLKFCFKRTVGELCFALRQKITSEDLRSVAQPLSLCYTTVFLSTAVLLWITCLCGLLLLWHVKPWILVSCLSASVSRSPSVSGNVSPNIHNGFSAARMIDYHILFLPWPATKRTQQQLLGNWRVPNSWPSRHRLAKYWPEVTEKLL